MGHFRWFFFCWKESHFQSSFSPIFRPHISMSQRNVLFSRYSADFAKPIADTSQCSVNHSQANFGWCRGWRRCWETGSSFIPYLHPNFGCCIWFMYDCIILYVYICVYYMKITIYHISIWFYMIIYLHDYCIHICVRRYLYIHIHICFSYVGLVAPQLWSMATRLIRRVARPSTASILEMCRWSSPQTTVCSSGCLMF